jgi:hypothetical protein
VVDYLYSEDALLDDHENELQEHGYFEDEWHHPKFHVSSFILYSILLPTLALNFFHWFSLAKMISYVLPPFKFNTLIHKSWKFSFFQCRFHMCFCFKCLKCGTMDDSLHFETPNLKLRFQSGNSAFELCATFRFSFGFWHLILCGTSWDLFFKLVCENYRAHEVYAPIWVKFRSSNSKFKWVPNSNLSNFYLLGHD